MPLNVVIKSGCSIEKNTFVIGGCRSGKSGHAQALAEQESETGRVYIATCVPYDDEMKKRVSSHQEERDDTWRTVETPLALPESILENSRKANVLLVDCLTLWVTNLLMENLEMEAMDRTFAGLANAVEKAECPVILVSNEVGAGIVPENKLARQFRDMAGSLNQQIAACVDRVVWTVAGIPVTIKG